MVAVIGRRADNVPVERAHEYVFGVTAGNDVSERDWQSADIQWTRTKGSKSFNAVGPVLVEGLDYTDRMIVGRLNGEERQRQTSADMVFDVNYMVSYVSRYFVLEPGDLIWSGTMGNTQAMEPGDVYEVEIKGVGVLRNRVVQGRQLTRSRCLTEPTPAAAPQGRRRLFRKEASPDSEFASR